MITAEAIQTASKAIVKLDVKGKNYSPVAGRIQAFRSICPEGSITTEIVALEDGVVTMKTTVTDETGRILATGFAQEKESSSYINKTSYIENAETSAVGRALGMLGIGSEESIASAEELANAVNNQHTQKGGKNRRERQTDIDAEFLTDEEINAFAWELQRHQDTMDNVLRYYKINDPHLLKKSQRDEVIRSWNR